jgi:hypothetical protein
MEYNQKHIDTFLGYIRQFVREYTKRKKLRCRFATQLFYSLIKINCDMLFKIKYERYKDDFYRQDG